MHATSVKFSYSDWYWHAVKKSVAFKCRLPCNRIQWYTSVNESICCTCRENVHYILLSVVTYFSVLYIYFIFISLFIIWWTSGMFLKLVFKMWTVKRRWIKKNSTKTRNCRLIFFFSVAHTDYSNLSELYVQTVNHLIWHLMGIF